MSENTGGDVRAPEDNLKKSSTGLWLDKDPFFSFRFFLYSSSVLVYPCVVYLAARPVNNHDILMPHWVSPSPGVNRHDPLHRLRFLILFKGALIPNLNILERELLTAVVQQLKDILDTVRISCPWLNKLSGANDVSCGTMWFETLFEDDCTCTVLIPRSV
jgi:hypothetical protein